MKCRGKLILFADADGATKFSDFEKLENTVLKNGSSLDVSWNFFFSNKKIIFKLNSNSFIKKDEIIVCGSRRHLEKDSVAKVISLNFKILNLMILKFISKSFRDLYLGQF